MLQQSTTAKKKRKENTGIFGTVRLPFPIKYRERRTGTRKARKPTRKQQSNKTELDLMSC